MFYTYDVETPDSLDLYIDQDSIGDNENYSTDDGLGIFFNEDFNGQITVPVYVEDPDGDRSEIFSCTVDIFSVNDAPYFSNWGDIIIDEDCVNDSCEDGGDEQYERVWAYDISPGADNEEQDIMFILNFSDLSLIENYSITPEGLLVIKPSLNNSGSTTFTIKIIDEESLSSDEVEYTFTINPVNAVSYTHLTLPTKA